MGCCLYLPQVLKNYQIDWQDNFFTGINLTYQVNTYILAYFCFKIRHTSKMVDIRMTSLPTCFSFLEQNNKLNS